MRTLHFSFVTSLDSEKGLWDLFLCFVCRKGRMGEYTHHNVAFALHLHWAADTLEPAQLHSRLHREEFPLWIDGLFAFRMGWSQFGLGLLKEVLCLAFILSA
jgi:hypothetical protein